MKKIPLVLALSWIIGSNLFTVSVGRLGLRAYEKYRYRQAHDPHFYLKRLIQTGPQKEALNSRYLAELMHISADRPTPLAYFNPKKATQRLKNSWVIKEASVKVLEPDTLYVDYVVRQPVALLADFENTALDEEGVPFPLKPFFTAKQLPEIYLGISSVQWSVPLKGKQMETAFSLLKATTKLPFEVKKIDVASLLAPSLGKREIVLVIQDTGFTRILRLPSKTYTQALSNYLELREKLPSDPLIVDLRLDNLGYTKKLVF